MNTTVEKEVESGWHRQAFAQTAPLFIQNFFMRGRPGDIARNATATFIKYRDRHFAVTCLHVLRVVAKRNQTREGINDTLALIVGRTIMNIAAITAQGLRQSFSVLHADKTEEAVDLVIADVKSFWGILEKLGGKTAIDFDNWREPRWSKTVTFCAFGYPDEHKTTFTQGEQQMIGSPLVMVTGPKFGKFGPRQNFLELRDRADEPHGCFFSGMSGGAIYAQQDEILVPAGIIVEGWPQSQRTPPHGKLDGRDIIVGGLTLTPKRLEHWLKSANLLTS